MSVKNAILENIIAIYITQKWTSYIISTKYIWIVMGIYLSIYPWIHYTSIQQAVHHPTIHTQTYDIFSFITYTLVYWQMIKNLLNEENNIEKSKEDIIQVAKIILIPTMLILELCNIITRFMQHKNIQNTITHETEITTCIIYTILYAFNVSSIIYLYIQTHQKNIDHINKCVEENKQKSQHAQQQLIRKVPKFAQEYFVKQYIYKNNIP